MGMKYTALIAAFLILMMVACAPAQQAAPVQPAAPAVPAQPAQPGVQPAQPAQPAVPGPTPVETKPVPVVSKQMQALLSKADQKVKSYKYLELVIPTKEQPDTISVKGSKVKIRLYEYNDYIATEYFDTVYLDTATKSIVGRCESNQRCVNPQAGDNRKLEWNDLNYDQYRPKTPYEFLKQIPATATIVGPEVHDDRSTTKIEYEEGGKLIQMWVDENYGIPVGIRIVPSSGEELNYKFNDMSFNSLLDKDVTPPVLPK